ncbi:MAG: LL-diaminopimelate aminotransferase [Clostridia bacterium]|nr:LL-diaminopimelate aminotransferase [Clostridia bacterium]
MLKPNTNYQNLKDSYLFDTILQKSKDYLKNNPNAHLLRLGVGDVTLPLPEVVIEALHNAVDDQSKKETFHGYMYECGDYALREKIALHYAERGIKIAPDEVFISTGACDELADIIDLFDISNSALVMEPAYPSYVETNVIAGRRIIRMNSSEENLFMPTPEKNTKADIIYICSPNNPTGVVFDFENLKKWVDFANQNGSIIIFDAAYEVFIDSPHLPRSIFEIEGAKTCAIEICSLSKTAGFTGTRLGYTVVPKNIIREKMSINEMWTRNRLSKTNGVSYILQKGAMAVFTRKGQEQIKANLQVYKENAKVLTNALDKTNTWYTGGKNSPYLWLRCPDNMNSWEFFDYLLNKAQIVGTPGAGFGKCGEKYFRLSSFGDPHDTVEAAKRLIKIL